jgi:lysophospholipase L1-like esterase
VLNPAGQLPVPTNRQVETVSGIIEEEAGRAGVPFLDLIHRLRNEPQWLESLRETDGVHPSARGHDLIAALVDAWLPWARLFRPDGSA